MDMDIQDIVEKFEQMCKHQMYQYFTAKVNEEMTAFEVDIVQDIEDDSIENIFNHFTNSLPQSQCRLCFFCFDFREPVIIYIIWSPDTSKIKEKMLCTCFADRIRIAVQQISKIAIQISATDPLELPFECINEKISAIYPYWNNKTPKSARK